MGCGTSICSCAETAVATVTPRVLSQTNMNGKPQRPRRKNTTTSSRPRKPAAKAKAGRKSCQWNGDGTQQLKDVVDDFDSEGSWVPNSREIEKEKEAGQELTLARQGRNNRCMNGYYDHNRHNGQLSNGHGNPGNLLDENSKWTVTVRLYTQKADQQSADIPSVEETSSHYSSGEWPTKSGSSQGSRGSSGGKHTPLHTPYVNGVSSDDGRNQPVKTAPRSKSRQKRCLRHSHSERPLTKEELARHDRMTSQALNPSYAWGNLYARGYGQDHSVEQPDSKQQLANGGVHPGLNGLPPSSSLPLVFKLQQKKYEPMSFSSFLSLGTNHYKKTRGSLRDFRSRQSSERPETWQALCDSRPAVMVSRPQSSRHTSRTLQYPTLPLNNGCLPCPSPTDSMSTDYLADLEIKEDFSGSAHSLTNIKGIAADNSKATSGNGTPMRTSMGGSGVVADVLVEKDSTDVLPKKILIKAKHRPKAALRRHQSEPSKFLI